MKISDLTINADAFAKEEIKQHNSEIETLYNIAMNKGIELAKHYNANIDVVKIGLSLMDCKLPKAQVDGTPEKHVEMSVDATKELLKKYSIDNDIKATIINCVEAHHGTKEYISIEAEIVANADCYKFIHPKGVFTFASMLGRRFNNRTKELEQLKYKLEEKYQTLSLDKAKEELEEYYKQFKEMLDIAKV
ncbi:MAG: hypothetical protein FWC68_03760 [Oscillospiraceae bacterium]|nr:hypothetical protein [Oscillospiraceae bacterium]